MANTSLASIIDQARFETIETHLAGVVADLKSMIKANPFQTEFTIYLTTASAEIVRELVYRFVHDGVDVTSNCSYTGTYYLLVKRELPANFVHTEPAAAVESTEVEAKAETPEPKKVTRVVVKTVKTAAK